MNNPHPTGPARPVPGRRRRRALPAAVAALGVALAAGVLVAHDRSTTTASSRRGDGVTPAAVGAPAPNGTFTTANGTRETIAASLRGHTTLVWLVAGGCASCAASIPAVAAHLGQITGHGVQVLTLGLYGDFPNGKGGVAQLLSFGQATAGSTVVRPGWHWGMASKALSMAYDPSGTPDQYVLVGPGGHIRYRNSVPDSTMTQLLAAATALSGHQRTTPSTPTGATSAATTGATLR